MSIGVFDQFYFFQTMIKSASSAVARRFALSGHPSRSGSILIPLFLYIIGVVCAPLPVSAQEIEFSVTPQEEPRPLHGARKGVKVSTDVLLVAMPVAALTGVLVCRDWEGLKQGAFTAAATLGATCLLKYTVHERRPNHKDYHSFPSAHTSATFATAAFLQRRYGWKFGGPAYALAAYVGFGRVYARYHHWWDVVAGGAIGAASAYIFTTPWAREHNLDISMGSVWFPGSSSPTPQVSVSCVF